MTDLSEIIRKRSCPAIFVFDSAGSVIFLNRAALDLCVDSKNIEARWDLNTPFVNTEILRLCENFRRPASYLEFAADSGGAIAPYTAIAICNGRQYAIRAFHVWEPERKEGTSYILVSIEDIIEKHEIDYERVKKAFGLSKREVDVLRLARDGLTNKKISARIFLSEHTVKDHLKSIMQKLKVHSRGELIAFLK